MRVLVTGASGFVGVATCVFLMQQGIQVRAAVRGDRALPDGIELAYISEVGADTDWRKALSGVDVVVHLAARVNALPGNAADPAVEYDDINVQGTLNLARQAAWAGVRRFIFLSSAKVYGERSLLGHPFKEDSLLEPQDAYGMSKWKAEMGLHDLVGQAGMDIVIIRPPLVYGPGVKANFETMMRWLVRGVPLPLGAVTSNRRSLVALDNLIDLIFTCLEHSRAANQTFVVSDGEDLSTADLLRRMGLALGSPARLFYVPTDLLKFGATLFNKQGVYQRLCSSLQVDIGKTRQILDWHPPLSVDEGLRRAAQGLRR